jgi:hypothetical protein
VRVRGARALLDGGRVPGRCVRPEPRTFLLTARVYQRLPLLEFGRKCRDSHRKGPPIPESVPSWIAIAALAVAILSLFISLLVALRSRGAGSRGRANARAVYEGPGIEPARVEAIAAQLEGVARRVEAAEQVGRRSITRVGVVRYNPFEDTGSNQSFALAMLDAKDDGFVISSLHSRQQTRLFLKQIAGGKADTTLSKEENEAIRRASEG